MSSLGKNKAAHSSFQTVVKETIQKERISFCASLAAKADMSHIKGFKWEKVASDIRKKCPLLWNVLIGATTIRSSEKSKTTRLGKNILPKQGTVVGMFGYRLSIKTMSMEVVSTRVLEKNKEYLRR